MKPKDFLPLLPWQGPPLPRGLISGKSIPETAILYHGSSLSNLAAILTEGIKPRISSQCESMIDGWLAEYGYSRKDLPNWIWKYPLDRCKETADIIHLSGDKRYAWINSQAGKEVEVDFRTHLAAWLKEVRGEELSREERAEISDRVYEPYSVLFKVKIPTHWIHRIEDYKGRLDSVMSHFPHMSEDEAWEYLLSKVTITVDKVPNEYIIDYEVVPYPAT